MNYRRSKTKGATFFFTVVTHMRKDKLCNTENSLLLKESFQHVANNHPFEMNAFVLLPDHIHCMWTLPENDNDFSMRWCLIKSYFTMHCSKKLKDFSSESRTTKGEYGVWQRRFWEHQIRDNLDYSTHVEYIHYNPVKHHFVKAPSEWSYSSFHQYVQQGLYESDWGTGSDITFDKNLGCE